MSFRALTSANFQLSGGWRQNLVIVGAYAALTAGLATLAYRTARPAEYGDVSAVCLSLITVIQGIVVLLVAPGAVRKAVLRDFQTGMIESHRLTPLSGLSLVLGYLTGPTAQAFLVYAMGLLLGGIFAGAYGQSFGFAGVALSAWYGGQLCLLMLGLLATALSLLLALASAGKANLTLLLVCFGVFGGWFVLPFVPGLALLAGVMSGGWLIGLLVRSGPITGDPAALGWAMLLQAAFAFTLLAAACRKVRAPDRPAFSVGLGLILLAVTGVTLLVGIHFFHGFARTFRWNIDPAWQWLGSSIAFLLVAALPASAAAVERARADRTLRLAAEPRPARVRDTRLLPLLLTLMAAVAMYFMLPWELNVRLSAAPLQVAAPLVLAIALSFWTDDQLVYFAQARGQSPFYALLFSWLALKFLPLAAEGVAVFVSEVLDRHDQAAWWLSSFSPVGTLVVVLEDKQPWLGLAGQLGIAVLATVLVRRAFAPSGSTKLA